MMMKNVNLHFEMYSESTDKNADTYFIPRFKMFFMHFDPPGYKKNQTRIQT